MPISQRSLRATSLTIWQCLLCVRRLRMLWQQSRECSREWSIHRSHRDISSSVRERNWSLFDTRYPSRDDWFEIWNDPLRKIRSRLVFNYRIFFLTPSDWHDEFDRSTGQPIIDRISRWSTVAMLKTEGDKGSRRTCTESIVLSSSIIWYICVSAGRCFPLRRLRSR